MALTAPPITNAAANNATAATPRTSHFFIVESLSHSRGRACFCFDGGTNHVANPIGELAHLGDRRLGSRGRLDRLVHDHA